MSTESIGFNNQENVILRMYFPHLLMPHKYAHSNAVGIIAQERISAHLAKLLNDGCQCLRIMLYYYSSVAGGDPRGILRSSTFIIPLLPATDVFC